MEIKYQLHLFRCSSKDIPRFYSSADSLKQKYIKNYKPNYYKDYVLTKMSRS